MKVDYEISGEQIRPFVRLWARILDSILFTIFLLIWIGIISLIFFDGLFDQVMNLSNIEFGIIFNLIFPFLEAFLLSIWGTTFGKAFFKVRVRKRNGDKLTYLEGLRRTFLVFFIGEGFGLPLITIVTQIVALNKLTSIGTTSWDEDGDFIVSHQIIGKLRVAILFLIVGLIISFILLTLSMQKC